MKAPGSIRLPAGRLQEAVTTAVPKRRKNSRRKRPWPVTIRFDEDRSKLEIAEAKHGLKGYEVDASGTWPEQVQVDGHMLRSLAEKYAATDEIELLATADELCLMNAGALIRIARIDGAGKKGIARRPIPPNPRHKGPVRIPPDPVEKRVELNDTWTFSARVPMPQHRKPKGD